MQPSKAARAESIATKDDCNTRAEQFEPLVVVHEREREREREEEEEKEKEAELQSLQRRAANFSCEITKFEYIPGSEN